MSDDRIVAVALLTRREVERLGPAFDRLWPVNETHEFAELLRAIDEAERDLALKQPSDRPNDP